MKTINVMVTFNNGVTKPMGADVDKSKYTSLQSKASSYKSQLNGGILTKKFTPEEAQSRWQKNVVEKWQNMVREPLMGDLPDEVRNSIVSFAPAGNLLDYEVKGLVQTTDAE